MTNEPYHRYRLFPAYKANRIYAPARRPRQVEKRALPAPNPELRFIFRLPDDLGFAVAPGPTKIIGVTVTIADQVEVIGHGRDWLFAQAAAFIRSIAKSYGPRAITGVLSCPAMPGTTVSGPMRPAISETYTVEIVSGDPVVIISKVAMRPLVFAGRK